MSKRGGFSMFDVIVTEFDESERMRIANIAAALLLLLREEITSEQRNEPGAWSSLCTHTFEKLAILHSVHSIRLHKGLMDIGTGQRRNCLCTCL